MVWRGTSSHAGVLVIKCFGACLLIYLRARGKSLRHSVCMIVFFFSSKMNKVTFNKSDENQDKRSISTGRPTSSQKSVATIIFSLKNEVGGLVKALKLFQVRVSFKVLKACHSMLSHL